MTLDQLKFQREALQEQLQLVDFRLKQLEQAQATEQREHRDQYLRSEAKPRPFWEQAR